MLLEAVYETMHDQRLIAMVKLAKLSLTSFFYNGGELVSGWSAICLSCDNVIWNVMLLRFMLLPHQTLPPYAAHKILDYLFLWIHKSI